MPTYSYSSAQVDRRATRRLESTFLTGLALMVAFLVASFLFRDQFGQFLKADARIFPLVLVGLYLFFLLPSRRLLRIQRTGQTSVATTRRGFTYKDSQGEKILSWRDVKQARIQVDSDRFRKAFPGKIVLVHAKGRISLDNDPPGTELLGARDLVREIRKRVPDTTFSFHWFHSVCPFCKADLPPRAVACPSCHERVRYVPKFLRPWELLREEGLYLILILLVVNMWPLVLGYLALVSILPLVLQRRSLLQPLDLGPSEPEDRDEAGEEPPSPKRASKTGSIPVVVVLVFVAALLMGATHPAQSAPEAPPLPVASPSTAGAPAELPMPWFPLAVGNRWDYQSKYSRVSMRVTGVENVNGVPCFVVHSFVGDATESSQVEYFSVTDDGVHVLKRVHKGSDFILRPPETMLALPLEIGKHWAWQGDAASGSVALAFSVRPGGIVEVMGQRLPTLLVVIQGRAADASELQTKRWYSRGVGLVRELTQLKKGSRSLKVDALLVARQVALVPGGR